MKTIINVSYNYGGWSIKFEKTFFLSFTPFYDLSIDDSFGEYENIINLKNTPYQTTDIYYVSENNGFQIDVRNIWKQPVREDVIDDLLVTFEKTNWVRVDNENIKSLKDLMKRNE